MTPEEYLRQGDLDACRMALAAQIRKAPDKGSLRLFFGQLLAVEGDWERALKQLDIAGQLDPDLQLLNLVCRRLIHAEILREKVFRGEASPLVLGEPPEWLASLLEANRLLGEGELAAGCALRNAAFAQAPEVAGGIDGADFAWLADGDGRLGPVVELFLEGGYYWCPLDHVQCLRFDPPTELRDLLWFPVTAIWRNGGEAKGFLPARYPASAQTDDNQLKLCRLTTWSEPVAELYYGLGQRVFMTDAGEHPLLEVRELVFLSEEG